MLVLKMMFTLRTTGPMDHLTLWESFDIITRESMSRILGTPLNENQWKQSQLPVSKGGLGLRSASDHAPAAYTTSLISSQDLKESSLNLTSEECPLTIPTTLLDYLSDKMGQDATSLSWVFRERLPGLPH